ncbi:uncharacterized protein LOC131438956 [Malaya genurostris]|uniref:uncharacterized protein LOC131438956 n=1 Tax=Malaya genurostris TaxID=325434 RepID=UPI0026F3C477|nr:uncharacterized protein LOC131438956 [Malaya genurostris]
MTSDKTHPHRRDDGSVSAKSSDSCRNAIIISSAQNDNNKNKLPPKPDQLCGRANNNCNNKPNRNNNCLSGGEPGVRLGGRKMLHRRRVAAVPQIKIVIDDDTEQSNRCRTNAKCGHRSAVKCERRIAEVSSSSLLTPSSPPATFWGFGYGNGNSGSTPRATVVAESRSAHESYVVDYELDEMLSNLNGGNEDDNSEPYEDHHHHHQGHRHCHRHHRRRMLHYELVDDDDDDDDNEDDDDNDADNNDGGDDDFGHRRFVILFYFRANRCF